MKASNSSPLFALIALTAVLLFSIPSGAAPDGSLKWQYNAAKGPIYTSPALGPDGTVYFGATSGSTGTAMAVEADGHTLKGSIAIGASILSSPTFGPNGIVYLAGYEDGLLYALDFSHGSSTTFSTNGSNIESCPALGLDGTIYFAAFNTNRGLYAVKNIILKWANPDINTQSSPAIGPDGTIYVGSASAIYAVNPDGKTRWSYNTGGGIYGSSPALGSDGTVYVGCYDGKLYAIDHNGMLKWARSLSGSSATIWSSPAIGPDGTIYIGSATDCHLYAVKPDGTIRWSYLTGGQIWSSPAVGASGTIYVGSDDGYLHAVKPADGSQRWTYYIGTADESSPIIGPDGVVYIGSCNGNLYAINTDCGGPAKTSWPMYHHDARHTGRIPSSQSGELLMLLGN